VKPFGGLNATPPSGLARIFMSPGPIYDPRGARPTSGAPRARCIAAGFRAGDVVLNCFSYHLTPGGQHVRDRAASPRLRGDPGRRGQTELQARAVADLEPSG
jgi:phenylacetate-CoA ligase